MSTDCEKDATAHIQADLVQKDLVKRLFSAIIIAAIVIVEVFFGGTLFCFFLLAASVLLAREYVRLVPHHSSHLVSMFFAAASGGLSSIIFLLLADQQGYNHNELALYSIVVMLGLCACAVARSLYLGNRRYWSAFGCIYIGLPVISLLWLRYSGHSIGREIILWLAIVVIATDSAAYFVGRSFGKNKLAPAISPGKTLEGALGGLLIATILGALASGLLGWPLISAAILAFVLSIASQAGDLFESYLKRRNGVKDSGSMIPGHGGVLDRLDGYMFATPVFAFLLFLDSIS